jgi:hypothetical protein
VAEKITAPETKAENDQDTNVKEIFIPRKTEKETLQNLGKLLKKHPGKIKVAVLIPNGGKPERMVLPYGVDWTENLEKEIQKILG